MSSPWVKTRKHLQGLLHCTQTSGTSGEQPIDSILRQYRPTEKELAMWRKSRGALFLTIILFSMTTLLAGEEPLSYPKTRRVEHTDDYHGTKVADPYRWLEDDVRKSPAVAEWVAEENKLTFAYLHA